VLEDIGNQKLPDGSEIPLPPILLGSLGIDASKQTLLVYGHLDVQPAQKVWRVAIIQLLRADIRKINKIPERPLIKTKGIGR